jgi:energy-coupling factor transporter ATP-binding protein EcfA2
MHKADSGVFFETFNAKYLDPEEVAEGYIYSKHLKELSGSYHAVLVGPRGSGKTTLLKMLQPAALQAWKGTSATAIRGTVKYSGVFIASDISWSRQLSSLGYGKLSPETHRVLVLACFTTHVLHSLLEAMIWRIGPSAEYRAAKLRSEDEQLLATQVMKQLQLTADIASLLAVKQALRGRLSEIRQIANRGSLMKEDEFRRELADTGFLHLDFLDATSNITDLFNDAVGEKGARWALLFDELETAPDWIVGQLFTAFRVSDPKIYLKLAISPVSATAYKTLMAEDGPAEVHDHRQIRLWYTDRVDAKGFCEALWESLTRKAGLTVSARDALGASVFEPTDRGEIKRRNPYAWDEHWGKIFASLKEKDRSFSAFLRAHHIDLERLADVKQHTRDAVLRKAAPVAAVRNFYLHEDRLGRVAARRRKTSSLFAGAESIFAISEGNPRWLIGLLTPLIAYMTANRVRRVPETVQAEEIEKAAERLLALLRTIPVPSGLAPRDVLGLNTIVERIGSRLHDDLMERQFSIDPRLSFTVDRQTPAAVVELLATGLNRGAVMLVSGIAARCVVGDMEGVTLRLSYLLAAKYGLPLRRGKSTNLSNLMTLARSTSLEQQLLLKEL